MEKTVNPGDKVLIKSVEEIAATLDEDGVSKNGLKFYSDMEQCCGQEFWIGRKGEYGFLLTPPFSQREWDIDWFIPLKLHITIDPRYYGEAAQTVKEICEVWKEV